MRPYLEIGSSWKIGEDWDLLNIDSGNIVHDIKKFPWPVMNDHYKLVYLSHVLEHIHWMDSVKTLQEIYRILEPGGVVEVHVPDFKKIAEAYFAGNYGTDEWWEGNPDHDLGLWVNGRLLRGQVTNEEPSWYNHRALFDEKHLKNCLEKAGFKDVQRIDYQRAATHGWINLGMKGKKP